jgi:PAS domain S-box-containing protein
MGTDTGVEPREGVRFRSAFEDAPAGMALLDPDGTPAAVNPAACEILGRPEHELLSGAFPPELVQREGPSEIRLTRGDGRAIWVDVRLSAQGICQFHDVTARHEAHEALRESEERLRTMVQTTHEGIATLDAGDRVTFANARMAEMLGYTVDEMLGRPVTDFYDEEGRREIQARLAGRRRGVSDQYEIKLVGKDGRELWAILSGSPLTDSEGRYAGGLAMVTDITERISHERAVRKSEERYRNIIETTTEGVWMIDGDHRTTYVNRRMAEMLGYRVEEMLGKPVSEFVPEEGRAGLDAELGGAGADAGRPREVRYLRKDGSEMWGLLSGSPLTDGSGAYGGALAMIADVTDRKRSEAAVARLAAIVESSPDAILSTDLEGRITSWNAAAERLYGYTEQEVIGRSAWMLVMADRLEEAREVGRTVHGGGSMVDFLSQARHKDGRTIDIAPSVSAIKSPDGKRVGTLAIVRLVPPRA